MAKKKTVDRVENGDIENAIEKYMCLIKDPEHRLRSFDYCYNYFRASRKDELLKDLEKSCLVLGFYLASWGMFRGSGYILDRNVRFYDPIIRCIAKYKHTHPEYWELDLPYDADKISKLYEIYKSVYAHLTFLPPNSSECAGTAVAEKPSPTLVTKVMLGVFASIPAFDTYFCATFKNMGYNAVVGLKDLRNTDAEDVKFETAFKKALRELDCFYAKYKNIIDGFYFNCPNQNVCVGENPVKRVFTLDFSSQQSTTHYYTKVKILDMFGFMQGYEQNEQKKARKQNGATLADGVTQNREVF
jgi:hypothetical protein